MKKIRMKRAIIRVKLASSLRNYSNKIKNIADNIEAKSSLNKKDKKILERNKQFHNIHAGKRAFVIANGPSVAEQDLLKLKDEITFVVNGFHKHPLCGEIKPNYYSIVDGTHFKNISDSDEFFKQIREKCSNSNFFVTLSRGYSFNEKYKVLPLNQTFYAATYGLPHLKTIDFTKSIPSYGTVAAFSIALAIYMGCNPIYLIGFDHDYLAYRGKDRHFYKGSNGLKGDIAIRNQSKNLSEIHSYYNTMKFMIRFWESYYALQDLANYKSIQIFNATKGGYLDVFERVEFEKIFEE